MVDTKPHDEAGLIMAIYETIRAPQTWPDLVRAIGDWMDADCGMMISPTLPGVQAVPLFAYGLDVTPIMAAYPKHAGRAEFTERALATGRAPGAFLLDELMPIAERATNDFWLDMVEPLGMTSGVFGMVRTPDDGIRAVILNYYRKGDRPAFLQTDATRLESLFPHLRRALNIALDAPPRRELPPGATDLYDAIGAPCFLLNAAGEIVHGNHAASVILEANDGVSIKRGRLKLWDADAQASLNAAIGRICETVLSSRWRMGTEILAKRPSVGPALVAIVTPLGAENPIVGLSSPMRCAVMILEERLRTNGRLPERLRRLYGLTEAEIDVAIDLATGRALAEIATARGTSIDTVRSQVKAALAKTNARRQADLASLVNRLRF